MRFLAPRAIILGGVYCSGYLLTRHVRFQRASKRISRHYAFSMYTPTHCVAGFIPTRHSPGARVLDNLVGSEPYSIATIRPRTMDSSSREYFIVAIDPTMWCVLDFASFSRMFSASRGTGFLHTHNTRDFNLFTHPSILIPV